MRFAAILAALLTGCGYSTGLQLAPEYESVGVEVFGNETPMRNIERDLHVAMTRFVRDRVGASLEAPGRADVVLRGDVVDVRFRPGIRTAQNQQVETGLTVVAKASLWDPAAKEVVAGPVVALTQVGYVLDAPFGEQDARKRLLENLAERLVLDLMTAQKVDQDAEGPPELPRR